MLSTIAETTSSSGLGAAPRQQLFSVSSGLYAGRKIALFKTDDNTIGYAYADAPFTDWSQVVTIADDSGATLFDAVMDNQDNLLVVYIENSTDYLVTKKLSYADGDWTVGGKVYAYNTQLSIMPSVVSDDDNHYHLAWSLWDGSGMSLLTKSSIDGGLTWGSGPSDSGTVIITSQSSITSKIIASNSQLYVVYTVNLSDIRMRSRALSGGNWSDEQHIVTNATVDDHFDAVALSSGLLGVVYDSGSLYYREFDGSNWGAVTLIDSSGGKYPQLRLIDNFPVIVYISDLTTDQQVLLYTHRQEGVFTAPQPFDLQSGEIDKLFLYDAVTASYADKTSEAADSNPGDIYHSSSLSIFSGIGDKLYIGSIRPFRFLRLLLSVAGAGGTVAYSYFDGTDWRAFVPFDGSYNFDATDKQLRLWNTYATIPKNWQKSFVNNDNKFWVKIEVTSPFSTLPVGSQVTNNTNVTGLSVRR